MHIVVRLFAGLAEAAGSRTVTLDLPDGATADSARQAIAGRFPATAAACDRVALAVNAEYAPAEQLLRDGDEVALIPPVSGG